MGKELNEKLYKAISEYSIDYDYIADLLKQGADPIGPLEDEDETALGQLFCEAGWDWHIDASDGADLPEDCLSDRLPRIMEVLIQYQTFFFERTLAGNYRKQPDTSYYFDSRSNK